MPFDFKKFDQKCSGLTPDELQREWQHYTRLITGAATSTTVSGLALPLTAGISAIGIGLAAPAIHNARKKREIVEKHLNSHQLTHVTRKRDVLGGVAVSGTIGVVTLGVGTLGADAIAAQGAEHGISAIVENDTAIKIVTHAALDGAGLAVEHAHTNHLRKKEAHKAFQAAGVFDAVADAKAAEAGYAVAGAGAVGAGAGAVYVFNSTNNNNGNYNYNDPNQPGYASGSNSSQMFYAPPPAYTDTNPPPNYYNGADPNATPYVFPLDSKAPLDGTTAAPTPSPYQQQDQQQQQPQQQQPPFSAPVYTYAAVPPQEGAPGTYDMRSMTEALPNSSSTNPQMAQVSMPSGHQELDGTPTGNVVFHNAANDHNPQPAPSSLPFHMQALSGRAGTPPAEQQQNVGGGFVSPRSSISQPSPSRAPSPNLNSRVSMEAPRDQAPSQSMTANYQAPQPAPSPMPFHMQAPGGAPAPAPSQPQTEAPGTYSPRHSISYSPTPTPLPSANTPPPGDNNQAANVAYLSPRSSVSYSNNMTMPSPLSASHTPIDNQVGAPPTGPMYSNAAPVMGGQGQWTGQPQQMAQVSYNPAAPMVMQNQMPPTPPVSTPGTIASQHSSRSSISYTTTPSYVLAPQYGHATSQSVSYVPAATTQMPQQGFFPPQPTPPMSQAQTGFNMQQQQQPQQQYYNPAAMSAVKPQYDPAGMQQQSQMFPPTPQSLPISPAGPTYGVANSNPSYFPAPPTGH